MGNVSSALKAAGMYDDVLFIVTTDNGGPTTECSTTGQSNWYVMFCCLLFSALTSETE